MGCHDSPPIESELFYPFNVGTVSSDPQWLL
jgi:hypothetical protein